MTITVHTKEQAWEKANAIFPTDYEKDEAASAGYDIYRHYELNWYSRICDLGDRLEVLTGEYGENVTNIWIEPEVIIIAENTGTSVNNPQLKYRACLNKLIPLQQYQRAQTLLP